jgi:hypothetical protein
MVIDGTFYDIILFLSQSKSFFLNVFQKKFLCRSMLIFWQLEMYLTVIAYGKH